MPEDTQIPDDDSSSMDALMGLATDTDGDGDEPSSDEGKPVSDVDSLRAELEEAKRLITEQGKKLEGATDSSATLKKLKEVFNPNADESALAEQKKLLEEHDADPVAFFGKYIDEKLAPVLQRIQQNETNSFAKEVTDEIDKEYIVNWNKDSQKVVAELKLMSEEYKKNDPKGAVLKAMQLASVGQKRPNDLPYLESAGSQAAMRARQKAAADDYLGGLDQVKKNAPEAGLAGFFKD